MRGLLVTGLVLLLVSGCLQGSHKSAGPNAPAAAGTVGPVPPGTYRTQDFARPVVDGTLKPLPMERSFLPSALDGVDIEVKLWRPDVPDGQVVPVLVDAGPYYSPAGVVPAGNSAEAADLPGGHTGRLVAGLLPHGYAVAELSVRGTAGSGGCMDLMGPKEVADLSQAITWLGEQPWSNGNVGMVGKSYDGSTPWQVAGTGNPHLKTIVPISGVPDMYELMFRNGTSEIRGPFLLNALYYSFALREQDPGVPEGEAQRRVQHTVEGLQCPDYVPGMFSAAYAGADGDRDPMGYWAARNLKPAVEKNYRGSIYLVQGLQDWNVDPGLSIPWIDQLNKSGIFVHQMLGQWYHDYPDVVSVGPPANMRWDWAELELRWFDYWLKRQGTVADLGPPVQVLDASGHWRVEDNFPPRQATWTDWYLNLPHDLSVEPGGDASTELVVVPVQDAAQLPVQATGATFRLPPQEHDLHVSGLPLVHITVTPHGPTGNVAAWLYDERPDGSETRIGWAMINLRFADGTQVSKDVIPGQPLLLKMQIQPMDAVVPAGDNLMLRIWEYRDDPGSTGDSMAVQGRLPVLPPSPVELDTGSSVLSVLRLPTVEPSPSAYFTPPS